ncbi:MAG: hypothetical protein E6G75_24800 [Alphaproteobacteria bacterium]|nr:MAG: hypothetical protein E6G75_24800 [Alphaproteobacteria bacterium]
MHEMAAHPDRRGLGIERQPDALAFEILRRADAAAGIDEDVAVSKNARGKHRQRDEWTIAAAHQADEFGRRQFRHVEFLSTHHAVENLASRPQRDAIEGEPRGDHIPLADRVHPIVTAAGKGQGKTRHGAPVAESLTRRRPVIHIGGHAHVDAVDGAITTDAIPPPPRGRGQPTPVIPCF